MRNIIWFDYQNAVGDAERPDTALEWTDTHTQQTICIT